MSEKKYDLAMPMAEQFKKAARKAIQADDESLDIRRVEYAKQELLLKAILEKMQELTQQIEKETNTEARQKLIMAREQMYSLASYKGITGLFEGAGLLMDMVTVELEEKEEEGKKVFLRRSIAEMLFDCADYLEDIRSYLKRQNKMIHDLGTKMDVFWKNKYGDPEKEEKEDAEMEAKEAAELAAADPVKVGLTEEEIAAKKQVTADDIDKALGKK